MPDMTPAPISVERLSPAISDYPGNHFEDAEPIMVATLDGEYVRHSDYAALLHQLAEREAEVERLRIELEVSNTECGEYASQAIQASFRAQKAERAREEATGLLHRVHTSLYLLDKPHREFGGVTDKTDRDIAAFLAASGGKADG